MSGRDSQWHTTCPPRTIVVHVDEKGGKVPVGGQGINDFSGEGVGSVVECQGDAPFASVDLTCCQAKETSEEYRGDKLQPHFATWDMCSAEGERRGKRRRKVQGGREKGREKEGRESEGVARGENRGRRGRAS